MSYGINPSKWNKIFAIPAAVVDEQIKLAGSAQLKVLLWTLRHQDDGFDIEKLSADTGIAPADALDAMQFWIETGILVKTGEEPKAQRTVKSAKPGKTEETPVRQKSETRKKAAEYDGPTTVDIVNASIINKPTNEDVAARGEESEEIRFLWNECQLKLGKTLSFNDQRTLLWMHDHLGLPVAVILMIVEYCASRGKNGTAYIEKVGTSWAQDEIFTVADAENKLRQIADREEIWNKLRVNFGMQNAAPTAKQSEMLNVWRGEFGYGYDMIARAFEECLDRTGKVQMNYINKVLSNWRDSGFEKPSDIVSKPKKADDGAKKTSYDLDKFEKASLKTPVYRKKGAK